MLVFAAGILAATQLIDVTGARADGAIAAGKCDNIGWAFHADVRVARRNAMQACRKNGDASCNIVTTTIDACAAIAISGHCGSRGWGTASTRARAEALALESCARYGGRECTVRKWVCS
jgi:Domain of unknown function (DUF4189)